MLLVVTFSASVWSCTDEYDDTAIWQEIDDLKAKIAELNRQMTTLRHALDEGCVITSVEPTAEGFLITFSNGETITVKHGSAGDAGTQIGVREEDGVLYWTLDDEFLLRPGSGERIPVRGGDGAPGEPGHAPVLAVDAEGYWTVDGTRVEDATGAEVKAQGDSFFRGIEQTDDAVSLILADGSTITIPKAADSSLVFDTKALFFAADGSQTVSYTARNLAFVELFSVSEGWVASLDERAATVTVTVPADATPEQGRLILAGADASGRTYMAAVQLYCGTLPEGGFFVYNEGQFGKMPASLNYYFDGAWIRRPYAALNPAQPLGNSGTTMLRTGTMTYLVAKDAPFVVETDAQLHARSVLGSEYGATVGQVMGMTVYDASTGYITTQNGVFRIGLNPLSLDAADRIFAQRNGFRDICTAGGKVFFIYSDAVYVYDPATGEPAAELCPASTGFVRTTDGAVWAADSERIVRIDPADNSFETVSTGDYPLWWESTYRPCEIAAAADGSALYFLRKSGSGWSVYGRELCKYDPASKTVASLWPLPEGFSAYGCGVRVDPATGDVYVVYTKDGWGANYLKTYIPVLSPEGEVRETIPYTSENETVYWFPSEIVF